ncbi:hypothetical protein Lalb_Chr05g0221451 [Lupinus albus]|uniref:Uncharacterized protein n=1 Tax=Lupinus albus TaxID=3870 RepID=A0A6A4QIP8_LUPAL|nr:hypothetical protein Lalb_Chr05g0221451 [Lupinus albus]
MFITINQYYTFICSYYTQTMISFVVVFCREYYLIISYEMVTLVCCSFFLSFQFGFFIFVWIKFLGYYYVMVGVKKTKWDFSTIIVSLIYLWGY